MSLTSVQSLFQYSIASLGQAFTPACPVQNTSDFVVTYTNAITFADTVLTLNVDYFVTGTATNGVILAPTVTLEAAGLHYASGGTLTIQRKNPFTQPTTYVDGTKYLAATANNSLDWLCYSIQALNDLVARCVQVPSTSAVLAPLTRAARASKVIGFDSMGQLTYYGFSGGVVVPQSIQGTANQVLVNGSSGVFVTGAAILTLPQSIGTGSAVQFGSLGVGVAPSLTANLIVAAGTTAVSSMRVPHGAAPTAPVDGDHWTTTAGVFDRVNGATIGYGQNLFISSTVRFGKVGINTAASADTDLLISRTLPTTTGQASVVVGGSLTPPAATDLHPNAFRDLTAFTPTQPADGYASYDAQTSMGGTVNLNHFRGFQVRHGFTGSGTLGEMSGYMVANIGLSGVGTITFLRGLYVTNATIGGGGSVGQYDGIYMDQLTNATGNVNAIYIAGNNRLFMAGGQIITSAALVPPAGATTCRGGFTFDQASQTGVAIMNSSATATGTLLGFHNSGGTYQGGVTQTNSTTVAYNTSSDGRLKENIRDMNDSGTLLDAMRPRLFDWKWGKGSDASKGFHGFIAQELHDVFPEAVTPGTDELDAQGNLVRAWGIDYAKLVPVLTAEVKDLRRRLAAANIAA